MSGDAQSGEVRHTVRPAPPLYVKLVVKRQKNEAADAEVIAEAPSRFDGPKTERQARAMILRTRGLLVRHHTTH